MPLACVLRGLEETVSSATCLDHRAGADRPDVRRLAKVYGARVIAIGRRKTQLDRAAAMGATS